MTVLVLTSHRGVAQFHCFVLHLHEAAASAMVQVEKARRKMFDDKQNAEFF